MTTTEREIMEQQIALLKIADSKYSEWKKLNRELGDIHDEYGYDGKKQGEIGLRMAELTQEIKSLRKMVDELESKLPGCWVGNE